MSLDKKGVGKVFAFAILGLFLISFMSMALAQDATIGTGGLDDVGVDVPGDADVIEAASEIFGEVGIWSRANLKFTDATENIDEYKGWLYAILLGMIIYTVISTFFTGSSKFIKWGITIATTAIAMIGIPTELYNALEIQYGAMGSAILAVIPFVIILFFTMKVGSLLIARVTWLFFILYSLVMSWSRFFGAAEGQGWPYVISFVVGLLMIWFVGFFRKAWFREELLSQVDIAKKNVRLSKARKEMAEASRAAEAGF